MILLLYHLYLTQSEKNTDKRLLVFHFPGFTIENFNNLSEGLSYLNFNYLR